MRSRRLLEWLSLLWRPPLFIIRVRGGVATASRGVVTPRFLASCAEVLKANGIAHCTIRGYRAAHGASLGFSRQIPDAVRQTLRNVWALDR